MGTDSGEHGRPHHRPRVGPRRHVGRPGQGPGVLDRLPHRRGRRRPERAPFPPGPRLPGDARAPSTRCGVGGGRSRSRRPRRWPCGSCPCSSCWRGTPTYRRGRGLASSRRRCRCWATRPRCSRARTKEGTEFQPRRFVKPHAQPGRHQVRQECKAAYARLLRSFHWTLYLYVTVPCGFCILYFFRL